jgi:hypothetical protein
LLPCPADQLLSKASKPGTGVRPAVSSLFRIVSV